MRPKLAALAALALLAGPAAAQTITVGSQSQLAAAIGQVNAGSATAINFSGNISLTSELPIFTRPAGVTINGAGFALDGGSTSNTTGVRGFFFGVPANTPAAGGGFMPTTASTNWSVSNLTIRNTNARGGDGSGGGAGLGGGIFVNAGALSLSGVTFTSNRAVGGIAAANSAGQGGGGMGGSSPTGVGILSGGGGFGLRNSNFTGGGGASRGECRRG